MRNPNDTRDVVPRFGSPPWIYIAAVSVAGAAVLGVAAAHLRGVADLANTPIFWVMAGMVVAADRHPIHLPLPARLRWRSCCSGALQSRC